MGKKVQLMQADLWWRVFFILLGLLLILQHDWVQASESATDLPQKLQAPNAPVLTLAEVIDLSLRDNRSLISSAFGVESQELSVDAARSDFELKLFPQATASATDETRRIGGGILLERKFAAGPIAGITPEVFSSDNNIDNDTYGSELELSLTIPLLRGFGSEINLDGVHSAHYALRTAKRSHYLVKVNTVLEAVAAVYNIVQQRELVNLYHAQASRFQGHAVIAESMEKIGLASPIDVYRAQIRLKDAQNNLNQAQEALRNAGDRLKIVLAVPLERAVQVVAPLVVQPVNIGISQAVETALQQRMELKQVEDDVEEAKRSSRISKNNLLPQLDLVTNYTRLANDDLTQFSEDFWSVNLNSTTDWSRKAEKAAYKKSILTVKRIKLNRATRIDTIKREVRQFYDALQKAQERMQIRQDQIDQASGKLALAEIKFGHGMANNFDLIEAETELQEARTNLLAAQIEYIVGMYRLRAALGTLIES